MRICKIYGGVYPWDVRVAKITRTLVEARYQVDLLCRGDRVSAVSENIDGVTIHRCAEPRLAPPIVGRLSTLPFPLNPRWTRELTRIVRDRSVDLLLVRDLPLTLNALLVAKRAALPVVLDMAENYPAMLRDLVRWSDSRVSDLFFKNPWIAAATERWVVRRCHHILVVVEESRDRLLRMGVAPDRVSIVSNTPAATFVGNPRRYHVPRVEGGPLRLIYVGGLQVGRGLEAMLLAVSEFRRESQVRLTILGEGPTGPKLEHLSKGLGLDNDVNFIGWTDPRIVPRYILESDVGVVPHLVTDHTNTTIPNKLFDYMAYARPVLVSDAAPMRRIVCQEHCGLYHRSGDVPDIVRKLRTLTDPEVRKRFGARGRQAVVERYNWDRDAERLVTTIGCNRWARRLC